MEIVFVRHGHRDFTDRSRDNGISEKGKEQVEDLLDDLENGVLPEANLFWSSPKKRCVETLQPLSDFCEGQFQIEPLLDEQGHDESPSQFINRLEKLLTKVKALKKNIYLCSHGDVIPEMINLIAGLHVDLAKGDAIIVAQDENGSWELK